MSEKEFEITIHADGNVEVHVKGFKGKSCLEAMKIFEEMLGEAKSVRHTSEYYEPEQEVAFRIEQKRS
jgi:hypothetical protein